MAEIACAASRPYIPHTAAMLHSVLTTGRLTGPRIHFLHGPDVSPRVLRRLTSMIEGLGATAVTHHVPDRLVAGLPTRSAHPSSHWYRILLPELLGDRPRVLYLDSDLIALDELGPLWGIDLAGKHLAAVANVFPDHDLARVEAPGLDPRSYFNSGVMVLDLELMRRDAVAAAMREYGEAHGERMPWPEQDALNAVLGDHWLALHPRWNLMNSILQLERAEEAFGPSALDEARENPAIRHFEGPLHNKPWHRDSDPSARQLYLRHREQTPWPRVRLEGDRPPPLRRLLGPLRAPLAKLRRRIGELRP